MRQGLKGISLMAAGLVLSALILPAAWSQPAPPAKPAAPPQAAAPAPAGGKTVTIGIGHEMVYTQWQKDKQGKLTNQVVWPAEAQTSQAILYFPRK